MPIFESTFRRKPGTRSNTKLVVSGGQSPAGQWVTDPNLPVLFTYDYGGPGQKEVVISKGMMVAVLPARKTLERGKTQTVITIADSNATDSRKYAIGMAPYNFAKNYEDFLTGNLPSVITRDYVELPLFSDPDDASLVKWGLVHGDEKNGIEIKVGDFLKVSTGKNAGKLTKWIEGVDNPALIVGQVLEEEKDQTPWGWLEWAQWDETAYLKDHDGPVNKSGYSAPSDYGYPYDPEYKEFDKEDRKGYNSMYTTTPTGVPGILDGSQKSQTIQRKNVTLVKGIVTATELGFKNIVDGSVQFAIGAGTLEEVETLQEVTVGKFYVDYKQGVVYYHVDNSVSETDGLITFRAHFYGTPAGWDHKGSIGVVRVLLKL
ncbi:MAG: hypothetical protein N2043_02305 [Ignavibacterium sp.]|nr:hypothetical protein [Ignavibacterium sp.]